MQLDTRFLLDTTRKLVADTQHSRTDWISPLVMLLLCVIGLFFIFIVDALQ